MTSALDNLRHLVQIPTISRLNPDETDWDQFDRFITATERLYPLVHALEHERVAEHSLLYRWAGKSPDAPTVLMAHYDVVAATDEGWEHPPFAAELSGDGDDRVLWGRGTIDDKGSAVAILEAVESHLATGLVPAHDIYLALGHDEETLGTGAAAIAELLEARGVRPAMVLDEGGAIVEGFLPGVAAPLAAVGVSEKGTTLARLVVDQAGGHASTPPTVSATARLARAIVRLNSRPFPAAFNPTTKQLLRAAGDHATGIHQFLYRNMWLTRGVLLRAFTSADESNAMTRTTQAVTLLSAGHAANALPEHAEATLNLRIAVGSSVEEAVAHVRKAIKDPAVVVEVFQPGEPMPVSPTTGQVWETLRATIEQGYPGVVVTPYVQTGATDSRSFARICTAIYRFTPFEMSSEERQALHAKNERIHVATWLRGIEFYRSLIARL